VNTQKLLQDINILTAIKPKIVESAVEYNKLPDMEIQHVDDFVSNISNTLWSTFLDIVDGDMALTTLQSTTLNETVHSFIVKSFDINALTAILKSGV